MKIKTQKRKKISLTSYVGARKIFTITIFNTTNFDSDKSSLGTFN